MLKNYFLTTLRFLSKNRTFSVINIVGLALGTLCCLYIVLYVTGQFGYDRQHKDVRDIYRVTTTLMHSGEKKVFATASPPTAPALKTDFSQVAQYTRVAYPGMLSEAEHQLTYKDKTFFETGEVVVDSTFFDVFSYHFVRGRAGGALDAPYSMVLMKRTADELFDPGMDPIGKTVRIADNFGKHDFTVTAVVDDRLGPSHIEGNFFVNMNSGGLGEFILHNQTWAGQHFVYSYVRLQPGTDPQTLERQMPAFIERHAGNDLKAEGMSKSQHLQPVMDIHTSTEYSPENSKPIGTSFLYLLLSIAGLIQLVACINFMNLSTARASKRAKEVGVRKVIGAGRGDLVRQFLSESLVISVIGVLGALPLLYLALPYLNGITGSHVAFSLFSDYRVWLILAGMIAVTGIGSGSYPAFYLSAFRAIRVIKGNFTNHISAAGIRRSLVVFQFVLSIVLIVGLVVVYSQLSFIRHKDLGFSPAQKLVFTFHTGETQTRIPAFMGDIRNLPEVSGVSRANNYPGAFVTNDRAAWLPGHTLATAEDAKFMIADEQFLPTTGIRLSGGRNFNTTDSGAVLINETLAHKLGLTNANAPGYRLILGDDVEAHIVGVIKDFNYNSLHDPIGTFMLFYGNGRSTLDLGSSLPYVVVSVASTDYGSLLAKMETIWKRDLPGIPFEYTFMDQVVQGQYETEITLARILDSFTLMAIFISCLGLFGLAAFSAEQRIKEIGIRKVLGASVSGIALLLTRDFLKLVTIALAIATPISWWAMSRWLQGFTYRVGLQWWMFGFAGIIAVVIALVTVSAHAIRAALAKPVKSLRSE